MLIKRAGCILKQSMCAVFGWGARARSARQLVFGQRSRGKEGLGGEREACGDPKHEVAACADDGTADYAAHAAAGKDPQTDEAGAETRVLGGRCPWRA